MNQSAIHVTRWGATGPRFLLIHGSAQGGEVGGDKHVSRQAELAPEGLQLLVPDQPGHGRSADPGRPDDAEADGEWAAELLGDGAHLGGHSFGGCVTRPEVRKMLFGILRANFPTLSDAEQIKRFSKLLHIPDEIRGGSDDAMLKRMGKAIKRSEVAAGGGAPHGRPFYDRNGRLEPRFRRRRGQAAEIGGAKRLVIKSPHHFPQLVSDEFNTTLLAQVRRSRWVAPTRPDSASVSRRDTRLRAKRT